jgi:hypothetical protein
MVEKYGGVTMVVKIGGKWGAVDKGGKLMGKYSKKSDANKRAASKPKALSEGITPSKVARLQRELELDLRQKQAARNTNPTEIRDITIAMDAIEDIKNNKTLIDGKVAGLSGNKYPRLLRAKELALRSEVLKSNPDIHKIADMYLTIKGLGRVSSDSSMYDGQSKVTNEMSVAGIAGPDATSQGPLVWGDKGPGMMKTSPHGKVSGKSDDTKKSKTKVDIDSKKLSESELSDDLNAMYGDKLKPSKEDVQSAAKSEDYVAGELLKLRSKHDENSRRNRFIADALRDRKTLENTPRSLVVNEAKKESKVNAAGNYTKPTMRKKLFKKIMAGTKGGDPGEWSARKAQLLAREYKKSGGGYKN